jgi:hypothetical protein
MQGTCDACGKQAELTEYTRKWLGGDERTSLLCSDCLKSIRKRPNRKHARLAEAEPPPKPEPETFCGTYPLVTYADQERLAMKEADFRPSITVTVDGEELLQFTGKNPTHQPSGRRFSTLRREVSEK